MLIFRRGRTVKGVFDDMGGSGIFFIFIFYKTKLILNIELSISLDNIKQTGISINKIQAIRIIAIKTKLSQEWIC